MSDRVWAPELEAVAESYDRALLGSCATDARLAAAEFEGERIEIPLNGSVPPALRKAAAKALETGGAVRLKIQAFGGWVSKPQRHKPEFLESVAASGAGAPIMGREHEGWRKPPVEGVVEGASYAGDGHALDADISLHGQDALRELSWGVMPRFSINPARTESTTATCSHCEQPTGFSHAWKTDHWPGELVDGKRVEIVWGGKGRLTEITRTYSPAADGTGIKAAALSAGDDWVAQLSAQRRAALAAQQENVMSGEKTDAKPDQDETSRLRAENEALKATLQVERDNSDARLKAVENAVAEERKQRQLAAAKDTVLTAARQGKIGPSAPEKLADGTVKVDTTWLTDEIAACAADPEGYSRRMSRIRGNPAFAEGRLSGAPGAAPSRGEDPVTHSDLKAEAESLTQAGGNPRLKLIQLTLEAQRAGRLVV